MLKTVEHKLALYFTFDYDIRIDSNQLVDEVMSPIPGMESEMVCLHKFCTTHLMTNVVIRTNRKLVSKIINGFQQHTATAVVFKSHIITRRLPNSVSIYTAELYAIFLALNELSKQQHNLHKHYLLFSDSLSSLNSIGNKKT